MAMGDFVNSDKQAKAIFLSLKEFQEPASKRVGLQYDSPIS